MASSDVNRLIDMLYERIEEAKAPALKPGMSIVDRDEMLDLLDELRAPCRSAGSVWLPCRPLPHATSFRTSCPG